MAPLDRPYYTSFYWSAIVNIALSGLVPFLSYLTLNDIGTIRKVGYGFVFAFHSKWLYLASFAR